MLDRAEARQQLGLPPHGRSIAWIGRLVPIKGPDLFMRALSGIRRSDWTACVIGDGPERPAMEAIARSSGVADRVRFAGLVHEAARYLAAFDLLVLSSRSEGTPIVVLEAMGAEVPVVATAVGGVSELLGGDAGGWLVPPEDPLALANAVDQALSDPAAVQSRTRFGRARVESELSLPVWIGRHEAVYHSAIRTRQSARRRSSG
jgi:glycosyltransferase involved in cell wall biosynthesis